jgi:hypothetical protein
MKKILLTTLLVFLCSVSISFAETITLAWDSNTEADMAGYQVYQSESPMGGNCSSNTMSVDVPHESGIATHTVEIDLVVPDGEEKTFYLRVLAYDTSQNQSECSNEVNVKVDKKPPTTPGNFDATVVETP